MDCPSNHDDGFLAILDMTTRIQETNAMWATMTNEALRRLRSTKRDLPWSVFAEDIIIEFTGVTTRASGPRSSRPPSPGTSGAEV